MQVVSPEFDTASKSTMRQLAWRCAISFDKTFDPTVDFFTIGVSAIGSDDIIAGEGSVLQEWDKYLYTDYSDRIISIEYNREQDQPTGSLVMATADIVLDNTDDLFTPNSDPIIGSYILPYRPIRISLGFNNTVIPIFVGLTEGMPQIDEKSKTAKFHCIDFIGRLYNRPLTEALVYVDMRSDEIIDDLLQNQGGLIPSQYTLDTGMNFIKAAFFEKNANLGAVIREICEAEAASFFMDEAGEIRFWNRQYLPTQPQTPVYWFNKNNTFEIEVPKEDLIVNAVTINADVREVQGIQSVLKFTGSTDPNEWIAVPAGGTLEKFFDFTDPVTDVDITPGNLGYNRVANSQADGNGTDLTTSVTVSSYSLFTTAIKVTFSNSSGSIAYVTDFEVFGTPAKVTKKIRSKYIDQNSVDDYEERPLTITNNFIQSTSFANSYAQIILNDRAELGDIRRIKVPALPQLQIGDIVTLDDGSLSADYFITKITGSMSKTDGFYQWLTLIKRDIQTYFTIGISDIGGDDVIAP